MTGFYLFPSADFMRKVFAPLAGQRSDEAETRNTCDLRSRRSELPLPPCAIDTGFFRDLSLSCPARSFHFSNTPRDDHVQCKYVL